MREAWPSLLFVALGCAQGTGSTTPTGSPFPEGVEVLAFEGPPAGPAHDTSELARALGSDGADSATPVSMLTFRPDLEAALVSGRREGLATARHLALRHDGLWSSLVEIGEDAMDRSYSAFARVDEVTTATFVVDGATHVYLLVDVTRGVAHPNGCGPADDRAEALTWLCSVTPELACFGRIDRGPHDYDEDNRLPSVQESLGACDDSEPAPPPAREARPTRGVHVDSVDRLCVVQQRVERCFSVGALYRASRASRPGR